MIPVSFFFRSPLAVQIRDVIPKLFRGHGLRHKFHGFLETRLSRRCPAGLQMRLDVFFGEPPRPVYASLHYIVRVRVLRGLGLHISRRLQHIIIFFTVLRPLASQRVFTISGGSQRLYGMLRHGINGRVGFRVLRECGQIFHFFYDSGRQYFRVFAGFFDCVPAYLGCHRHKQFILQQSAAFTENISLNFELFFRQRQFFYLLRFNFRFVVHQHLKLDCAPHQAFPPIHAPIRRGGGSVQRALIQADFLGVNIAYRLIFRLFLRYLFFGFRHKFYIPFRFFIFFIFIYKFLASFVQTF